MIHALLHVLGITSESTRWYAFWSGFGSDLGLLAGTYAVIRHKNCHTKGCWRLGRHPVRGTPYVVCARHHPDVDDEGYRP